MRAVVILAPTGAVTPNVTAYSIAFLGGTCLLGAPTIAVWLARLNGWL